MTFPVKYMALYRTVIDTYTDETVALCLTQEQAVEHAEKLNTAEGYVTLKSYISKEQQ